MDSSMTEPAQSQPAHSQSMHGSNKPFWRDQPCLKLCQLVYIFIYIYLCIDFYMCFYLSNVSLSLRVCHVCNTTMHRCNQVYQSVYINVIIQYIIYSIRKHQQEFGGVKVISVFPLATPPPKTAQAPHPPLEMLGDDAWATASDHPHHSDSEMGQSQQDRDWPPTPVLIIFPHSKIASNCPLLVGGRNFQRVLFSILDDQPTSFHQYVHIWSLRSPFLGMTPKENVYMYNHVYLSY